MGIKDRREREKVEIRKLILSAARDFLLTNGYEKTSIRAIAKKASYSSGTIYLYFKDKNEILLELQKEAFETLSVYLIANFTLQKDNFSTLVQFGENYLKFGLENPQLYELLFLISAPLDEIEEKNEFWELGYKMVDIFKNLIEQSQIEGYFTNLNIDSTGISVFSFVHGLITLYLTQRMSMFDRTPEKTLELFHETYKTYVKIAANSKNQ